jgi:hypothetical protein
MRCITLELRHFTHTHVDDVNSVGIFVFKMQPQSRFIPSRCWHKRTVQSSRFNFSVSNFPSVGNGETKAIRVEMRQWKQQIKSKQQSSWRGSTNTRHGRLHPSDVSSNPSQHRVVVAPTAFFRFSLASLRAFSYTRRRKSTCGGGLAFSSCCILHYRGKRKLCILSQVWRLDSQQV